MDAAQKLLADILATGHTLEEFLTFLRIDPLADTICLPSVLEPWTYPL
ncbi:hypothetical protein [Nocardia sp. NPDC051463]